MSSYLVDAFAPCVRYLLALVIVAMVAVLARDDRDHAVTYVRDAAIALDDARRLAELRLELARRLHDAREYEPIYDARAELRRLQALQAEVRRQVAEARAAVMRPRRCNLVATP